MRILVTGANGFIGSHFVRKLAAEGNTVYAVTRNPVHYSSPLIRNVNADLTEKNFTTKFDFTADAVVLLAQSRRMRDPDGQADVMDVNANSSRDVLEWAKRAGVKKVVLASTGSVYKQTGNALKEDDAVVETGVYPLSKLMAEQIANAYSTDFNVIILRLFTPYGPGQTGMLVSRIIENVRRGEVIQLAEGKGIVLSPLYIDDCCEMIQRLLEKNLPAGVYNLGGGEVISLEQIIRAIETELGIKAKRSLTEEKPPYIAADSSKLMTAIDYIPQIKIKDGIHRTIHST
jgi:nucleoside-diphosphate-sugar epimerase